MTDPAYTHIAILADRTGSMGMVADPGSGKTKAELTTKGIRDLIAEQAAQGKTTFSLVQFDSQGTERVTWFEGANAPALKNWKIFPRGGTPLLDALGLLIANTGEHLGLMPEDQRPGRVIFVIGTDGQENASHEYTKARIRETVAHQRDKYGWDFVFIGADFDAFAEAGGMGIDMCQALRSSGVAMAAAYSATSDAISRARAGGQSVFYSDDERDRASGKP